MAAAGHRPERTEHPAALAHGARYSARRHFIVQQLVSGARKRRLLQDIFGALLAAPARRAAPAATLRREQQDGHSER